MWHRGLQRLRAVRLTIGTADPSNDQGGGGLFGGSGSSRHDCSTNGNQGGGWLRLLQGVGAVLRAIGTSNHSDNTSRVDSRDVRAWRRNSSSCLRGASLGGSNRADCRVINDGLSRHVCGPGRAIGHGRGALSDGSGLSSINRGGCHWYTGVVMVVMGFT